MSPISPFLIQQIEGGSVIKGCSTLRVRKRLSKHYDQDSRVLVLNAVHAAAELRASSRGGRELRALARGSRFTGDLGSNLSSC